MRACLIAVFAAVACAQEPPPSSAGESSQGAQSRAAQIELERKRKAAELAPEQQSSIEHALDVIEDKQILQRLTSGTRGFRVRLGGLITGSGFAVGPEYYRRFVRDQFLFRASARASVSKYYLMEMELAMPPLANNRVFFDLYGAHRRSPRIDYYGPGPNSVRSGRTRWLLEDTSFRASAGVTPVERLHLGLIGRYLRVNVGPGTDPRFATTEATYTEAVTPGVRFQTNFLEGGGFAQYDWRDNPGGPRHGGNYLAQYTNYSDVERNQYSFSRVDIDLQQYIGMFNHRRVIALRGRLQATDPHAGNAVPFYLQPTLGGSDDLRGFRAFRFYDNAALVFNAEYRWEIFSGLDMALFADAGRVYPTWRQIKLRDMETDYGFGFRFNVRNDVFLRIDTGFSREGFMVWFKFGNVF